MGELIILLAGKAGEGIQTVGEILSSALASCGYEVFSWQDFESRIRGGQSSCALRVSDYPVNAPRREADVLLALNDGARDHYRRFLRPGGLLLCQGGGEEEGTLRVDFARIAEEEFGKKVYANVLATGMLAALAGIEEASLLRAVGLQFGGGAEEVLESNLKAAGRGYGLGREALKNYPGISLPCRGGTKHLLTGHEALALGAAWAGCRFISAYPMSPSTSIITYFAQNQEKLGVFAEQAEDEIAAVNMAIGASFAGARAMTATSGGGFALMVESISLAGMTETPVVIVLAQRPGPATGLPTRTAQGDLLFAIHAGHGEFPKAVLAPADALCAFDTAVRAFDLADRFQIPVVILTDQYLADSKFCYGDFPLTGEPGRPLLADPGEVAAPYLRYRLTPDGVSPRLRPGQSAHLVCADSDEHDEAGHITEELVKTVPAMVEKRQRKAAALKSSMKPPSWEGPEEAKTVLVGFGSTRNSLLEAAELLRRRGESTATLHFTELWPLPEFSLRGKPRLVCVESNATGQLEGILSAEYGFHFEGRARRFDGLPMDADFILDALGGGR